MSIYAQGKNSKMSLARTSSAAKTDITGRGQGTDALSRGINQDTATRPARGRSVMALGNFVAHDFGVSSMTSHATHDGLLRDGFGQRYWGDYAEEGTAKGNPKVSFEAVAATLSLSLNNDDDSCTWGISLMVDGTPTVAAYAEEDTPMAAVIDLDAEPEAE